MSRCLAFDLGRVLFDFEYNIGLNKIRDKIGVKCECIIESLFYEDFAVDFEKGLISPYDFYLKFIKEFKSTLDYQEFMDAWCDIFSPKDEMISLVSKLKNIYSLYLISNINEAHFKHLYKQFSDIFSLFDGLVLSFEVKSIKPEAKIYQELQKISGTIFEQIVYIDDRHDLIEKANDLGLNCIKFNELNQLTEDLKKYQVFIPLEEEMRTLDSLKETMGNYKKPLIVGLGNRLRSDDMIGSCLASSLGGKISIDAYDVGEALENHLAKLKSYGSDIIIFIDATHYEGSSRFKLFSVDDIIDNHLFLTHNSSLKLAIQYLQEPKTVDILILGIKGYNFSVGEVMSKELFAAKSIIESFFIKNFCLSRPSRR